MEHPSSVHARKLPAVSKFPSDEQIRSEQAPTPPADSSSRDTVVASTPVLNSANSDSVPQMTKRKGLETILSKSILIGPLEVYVNLTCRR